MLDDERGGDEARVGEGVGEDFGAEVEVRVAVADEHGGQRLAGVEDRGGQAVAVGAGEAGVDQQGLALAGDERGGLVLAAGREVEVEDLESLLMSSRGPLVLGSFKVSAYADTVKSDI